MTRKVDKDWTGEMGRFVWFWTKVMGGIYKVKLGFGGGL